MVLIAYNEARWFSMHTRRLVSAILVIVALGRPIFPTVWEFESAGSESRWDLSNVTVMERIASIHNDSIELVVGVNLGLSDHLSRLFGLASSHHGIVVDRVSAGNVLKAIVVSVPLSEATAFASEAEAGEMADFVEPNLRFRASLVPNDTAWRYQWGPLKIEAPLAWNKTVGNHSVLVAVIDTGVDYGHSDLLANYVSLGYDWVNNDTDPADDNGHGTHCAGVIAAAINNGAGIAGLAQVRLMAEKGLDSNGDGNEADLAKAIIHATDEGAKVISMSWGGYEESTLLHDAIEYAYNHSVLLIAAAGNDATNAKMYPAAYPEVIGVTATDQSDALAYFTNYGDWIELAAPGLSIYSTLPGNHYGYMSGTSMATPHVAGLAALVWSMFPLKTRDEVRVQLRETADDLGTPGFDYYYGFGRINAREALTMVHDLAVRNVTLEKTVVGQGFVTAVCVEVANQGLVTESFNLTLSANSTTIQVRSAVLAGETSTVFTLAWDTTEFVMGNYVVSAGVSVVENETVTTDNIATGGTIIITIPGDVDGNSVVNLLDIVKITSAYSSEQGQPQFVPNSDVNGDGEITMSDIVLCASHYGQRRYSF